MNHVPYKHFLLLTACLALILGLSGCVIIPLGKDYPHDSSRHDTGDFSPSFIVEHKTSRDEVVARLGPPDGKAEDGSWVVYAFAGKQSSTGWIVAAPSGFGAGGFRGDAPYRILTVQFDSAGVAAKVTFEEKVCPNSLVTQHTSAGCVSLLTREIRLPALLKDNVSQDEGQPEVFDIAMWWPDTGEHIYRKKIEEYHGVIAITEKSLTFIKMPITGSPDGALYPPGTIPSLPGPKISIPFSEFQSAKAWSIGLHTHVVITTRDGKNSSFFLVKGNRVDRERTEAAAALLERRIQAFRDKEQAH